jgi:hypothetical protein
MYQLPPFETLYPEYRFMSGGEVWVHKLVGVCVQDMSANPAPLILIAPNWRGSAPARSGRDCCALVLSLVRAQYPEHLDH